MHEQASLVAQLVNNPPAMQETLVQFLDQEDPWSRDRLSIPVFLGFPGSSYGKESACNARNLGSIPGLGRSPGGGQDNPLQYSCLENLPGERNPAGYSPWGRKESDTNEHIDTVRHTGRIYRGLTESGARTSLTQLLLRFLTFPWSAHDTTQVLLFF